MSMHEMEYLTELGVVSIAGSDLSLQQKRNIIHTLFEMESHGDCGFTNLRTITEMLECQYSFLFEPKEMFDFESNREFYDSLPDNALYDKGCIYPYYAPEDDDGQWTGQVCVDSGSEAWEGMVRAGKITGEGAKPVELLPFVEAVRVVRPFIDDDDDYALEGLAMTVAMTDIIEELEADEFEYIMGMTHEDYEELLG